MERADVFVLPSVTAADGDEEGTPTVLLEAAASGLPVLSTRHSGIPEIVADGVSGILVSERSPAELAIGLKRLIDEPECRTRMGRQGRVRIESKHDVRMLNERLANMYERALN